MSRSHPKINDEISYTRLLTNIMRKVMGCGSVGHGVPWRWVHP